jgi:hypothetical protein
VIEPEQEQKIKIGHSCKSWMTQFFYRIGNGVALHQRWRRQIKTGGILQLGEAILALVVFLKPGIRG